MPKSRGKRRSGGPKSTRCSASPSRDGDSGGAQRHFAGLAAWYIAQSSRSRRELLQLTKTLDLAKQDAKPPAVRNPNSWQYGNEIRTPLNGVMGLLGLLVDSRLLAEPQSHAQSALRRPRTC